MRRRNDETLHILSSLASARHRRNPGRPRTTSLGAQASRNASGSARVQRSLTPGSAGVPPACLSVAHPRCTSPLGARASHPHAPYRDRFLESPFVSSFVSGIRTPTHSLRPVWEQGTGGMRGTRQTITAPPLPFIVHDQIRYRFDPVLLCFLVTGTSYTLCRKHQQSGN